MAEARRILLCVRASDDSGATGTTAAWLATQLDASITIVHVATEIETASDVAASSGLDDDAVRDRMLEEVRELTASWGRHHLEEVPFEVVVTEGKVAERIAAVAAELRADLVVVGSQGRGKLGGIILGDAAADILRLSPCPVVVVPPRATEG